MKCGQTAGPIGNKFCTYNAGESGNGNRFQIGPMRHQGEHFDAGISRGEMFWVLRGVNISKFGECHDLQ